MLGTLHVAAGCCRRLQACKVRCRNTLDGKGKAARRAVCCRGRTSEWALAGRQLRTVAPGGPVKADSCSANDSRKALKAHQERVRLQPAMGPHSCSRPVSPDSVEHAPTNFILRRRTLQLISDHRAAIRWFIVLLLYCFTASLCYLFSLARPFFSSLLFSSHPSARQWVAATAQGLTIAASIGRPVADHHAATDFRRLFQAIQVFVLC